MTRADRAFAVYLAATAMIVAFMATAEVRKVVVAGFSAPAALASDQVPNRLTDRGAGPVRSSWVARALWWR
jgi:hypothetical protein